jgi:hypothetical protein
VGGGGASSPAARSPRSGGHFYARRGTGGAADWSVVGEKARKWCGAPELGKMAPEPFVSLVWSLTRGPSRILDPPDWLAR